MHCIAILCFILLLHYILLSERYKEIHIEAVTKQYVSEATQLQFKKRERASDCARM